MTTRILFAGLVHETHSFLSDLTELADFSAMALNVGEASIGNNRGNGSPSAGFIDYAERAGWQIIPTVQMSAMPSGPVADSVVQFFLGHLLDGLDQHINDIDGVFLVLHGAMVSQSCDDVEGMVLRLVRDRLIAAGRPELPIAAVLDPHGNVTQDMVDASTVLRAYRENPHTDAYAAAVAAAELLAIALREPGLRQLHRPTRYVLPPTGTGSASAPIKTLQAAARAIEAADPDILSINVMFGYAYSDIADCGFSLNCVTRGPLDTAARHLDDLEVLLVANLAAGYPREDDLDTALAKADAVPPGPGPILLIEAADNIGGGTPGDATGLLDPLLATGRTGILAALADPDSVATCAAAGLGQTVTLDIGAKTDRHHGDPIRFTGTVTHLSDGGFDLENPHSHLASLVGTHAEMGPCAVLANAQATVLLSARKMPPMDLGQFHSQGLRPEDATYVVIKAAVSHRAAYDAIARASFYVDTPGLCTSNLRRLPYAKLTGKVISLE